MDIPRIVEFISSYPIWFRYVLVLWMLVSAVVFSGLFLVKGDRANSAQLDPAPPIVEVSATPSVQRSGDQSETSNHPICQFSTFREYVENYRSTEDRFYERQEFVKSCDGKSVSWTGYVYSVSERQGSIYITLSLNDDESGMNLLVAFPQEFKTKAFSLRKRDHVVVSGTLSLRTPNFPDIDGTSLGLVPTRVEG